MQHRAAASLIAVLATLFAAPGAAHALQVSPIGDFELPTGIAAPPGDVHRLFVAGMAGAVDLLHDGVRKRFLTLDPAQLATAESGLLSLAFAPDYATSGLLYLYYTAPRQGDPGGNVGTLLEVRRSATDPDAADPSYRRVVLTVDHPGRPDHNGGQLAFGPGGKLYLSTGDGGGENEPDRHAQDPASLLGKVLRIDPRAPAPVPEVYASGLRNPWRFSFDRLTGDMVIADVGQHQREEIDLLPKGTGPGANLGWSCREGLLGGPNPCTGPFVEPVLDYDHGGGRCSVTGGYVVRNRDTESVFGRYVYVDLCGGEVRSVALGTGSAMGDAPTGLEMKRTYTFGEDACGHVYLGTETGHVYALLEDRYESLTPCPEPPAKPPARPPPARDRTPPRLTVARRYRQHLGRHRSLYVSARCDERCSVTAGAKAAVSGHASRFAATRSLPALAAGRTARLRLLLSPAAARAARAALRAGKVVRANIRVVARDAAGNRSVRIRPVLVLR